MKEGKADILIEGKDWTITLYNVSTDEFRVAVRTLKSAMLRNPFVIRLLESFDDAARRLEKEEADLPAHRK